MAPQDLLGRELLAAVAQRRGSAEVSLDVPATCRRRPDAAPTSAACSRVVCAPL